MPPKTLPNQPTPWRGFFASPRNQRRFFVAAIVVFAAGVIAISLAYFRGTSDAFKTPISTTPAQLAKKDPPAKPTAAAFRVARKFIETAVMRRNIDASYDIVHPDMKGRMTRKQWDTGNIPVIDYPADNAKTTAFIVDYSYRTQMLLEADLVAKAGASVRPHLLFFLGLKRAGGSPTGRWLVNYWEPHWKPPIHAAP
jgi:hypothetical protein